MLAVRSAPRGADLHVRHHTDLFYVLEGELTVRLGAEDRAVVVPAGTLARAAARRPRLPERERCRGALSQLPRARAALLDYLRAMRDGSAFSYDQHEPPADGGRPSSEAVGGGAEVLADGVSLLADVEELGMARRGWRRAYVADAPPSPARGVVLRARG